MSMRAATVSLTIFMKNANQVVSLIGLSLCLAWAGTVSWLEIVRPTRCLHGSFLSAVCAGMSVRASLECDASWGLPLSVDELG